MKARKYFVIVHGAGRRKGEIRENVYGEIGLFKTKEQAEWYAELDNEQRIETVRIVRSSREGK